MASKEKERRAPTEKARSLRRETEGEGEAAARSGGGLEQVREILFGATYRELELRLGRIEAHLIARADELLQETRRRTEALEGHVTRETEALTSRLEKEHAGRLDSMNAAARESHEAIVALDQRLVRLEEALAQTQRDGRRQLLDQAKSFLDELHRVRSELIAMLEREFALSRGEALEAEQPGASP